MGQFVVRIEIGWLIALPHNKIFKFTDEGSEERAFLKAAGLAVVQPYCILWREENEEKLILYKGDEWTDPTYHDIWEFLREEKKSGSNLQTNKS